MSGEHLRVVELYSGIGGMHFALQESGLKYEVVAAVEINNVANLVYQKNFPSTTLINKCLLTLQCEDFEDFHMDMLVMSPPCQPFTCVGKQRDVEDDRTKSLLHVLQILKQMGRPPRYVLVENVRGFEKSQARLKLIETLESLKFNIEEILCCPSQFGIPNSRLRYFLLSRRSSVQISEGIDFKSDATCSAKKSHTTNDEGIQCLNRETCECPQAGCTSENRLESLTESSLQSSSVHNSEQCALCGCDLMHVNTTPQTKQCSKCSPQSNQCDISHYNLSHNGTSHTDLIKEMRISDGPISRNLVNIIKDKRKLEEFLEPVDSGGLSFAVPKKFYRQFWVMDLVQPNSEGSCCFTKRYGHYIEGAGSVLQMKPSKQDLMKYKGDESNEEFISSVDLLGLRFFSPREISNILCFPKHFLMPGEVTTKQWYRLLGNSLNVSVVSFLLQHLTRTST